MTPKMFLGAASAYKRPIIVFSVYNKMAYFEKEYLPLPDLGSTSEVVVQEPIYIYGYGNIRYKLLIHRTQI